MNVESRVVAFLAVLVTISITLVGCCGVCTLPANRSSVPPRFSRAIPTLRTQTLSKASSMPCDETPPPGSEIASLSPKKAIAGGLDFFLYIKGSGFTDKMEVTWNGDSRATKLLPAGDLRAHILKTDILNDGVYAVTVRNPDGSQSNSVCFDVVLSRSGTRSIAPATAKVAQMAAGPADLLTVGAIALALNDAINQLQGLLESASADAMAVGESLEGNAHGVLADLQGKLNYQISQLHKEDQLLVNNAQELIKEMNIAATQLALKATDDAKLSMYNADILAYETSQGIPCQPHLGRLLYGTTGVDGHLFKFIYGIDDPEIRVYGNWLQLQKAPVVTVHSDENKTETPTQIESINDQYFLVKLPDSILSSTQQPDHLFITTTPAECIPHALGRSSISDLQKTTVVMDLVPRDIFDVEVDISPTAEVGADTWDWGQSFYLYRNDCSGSERADRDYCLPDAVESQFVADNPWSVVKTTANCGSDIDRINSDGPIDNATCMTVHAFVQGCGTSWFGLNCNGHGWLGYNLSMHYLQYARQALNSKHADLVVTAPNHTAGPVTYDIPVPSHSRNLEWHWKATVMIKHGADDPHPTPVFLSDDVPNDVADGVYSSFDESTGTLTITLP